MFSTGDLPSFQNWPQWPSGSPSWNTSSVVAGSDGQSSGGLRGYTDFDDAKTWNQCPDKLHFIHVAHLLLTHLFFGSSGKMEDMARNYFWIIINSFLHVAKQMLWEWFVILKNMPMQLPMDIMSLHITSLSKVSSFHWINAGRYLNTTERKSRCPRCTGRAKKRKLLFMICVHYHSICINAGDVFNIQMIVTPAC